MQLIDLPTLAALACSPRARRAFAAWRAAGREGTGLRTGLRALRALLDGERVVRHAGTWVFSSFLPPFPSRAFTAGIAGGDAPTLAERMRGARRAPVSVYCALTGRCGSGCAHCSNAGRTGDLPTADWRRILGGLQDAGTAIIGFTGGEPLLRPDLDELIATVDDRSATILFTSGQGLDAARARRLRAAGLWACTVSLDSADPAEHDRGRGRDGAWAEAVAALRACREAGLYTLAQAVVTPERLHRRHLFRLLRRAKRAGAHEVRVIDPVPCGRLAAAPACSFLDPAQRARLIALHRAANRRPWLPKMTSFAHTEHGDRFGCGAGSQHAYVACDGRLQPCDFLPLDFGAAACADLPDRLAAMRTAIGPPRRDCLARTLAPAVAAAAHRPLPPDDAQRLCRTLPAGPAPGIYARLAGS